MKKFDNDELCPKCGAYLNGVVKFTRIIFEVNAGVYHGDTYHEVPQMRTEERIEVTCFRCGYSAYRLPLDAPDTPEAA